MTSVGNVRITKTLIAESLGSASQPVKTIHRASTDIYQNDLNWIDADTSHTRLRLKEDGHLQIVEDIEFFSGPSITNSTKKYSIGLNQEGDSFVVHDEVENVDLLKLNSFSSGDSDIYSYINRLEEKLSLQTKKLSVVSSGITTASSYNQIGSDILGESSGDKFGNKVALNEDGTILAATSIHNDGNGNDSGHVRVYQLYQTATSAIWSQIGQDIDGSFAGDNSGSSIALSSDGTIVAVGSTGTDQTGTNSGSVRIFEYNATAGWVQRGTDIDGETAREYSGFSLDISADGNIVVIGAIYNSDSGEDSGSVRTFQWDGAAWTQMGQDIDGQQIGGKSGYSVSISKNGDIVAVGSITNNSLDGSTIDVGVAKIYQYRALSWQQLGQDLFGQAENNQFGNSISLNANGDIVAIAAVLSEDATGLVRIYELSGNKWKQIGATIEGENTGNRSGASVSISNDGTIISVGAYFSDGDPATPQNYLHPGNTKIYQWNSYAGVQSWSQIESINGTTTNDHFGWSVSLSGDARTLASGCITNDDNGNNSGKVQAFALN